MQITLSLLTTLSTFLAHDSVPISVKTFKFNVGKYPEVCSTNVLVNTICRDHSMKNQKVLSSQPIPNLCRGIPPSACSGTYNLQIQCKRQSHLGALALRTGGGGGRLKSSFIQWEHSLHTQVAHGYGNLYTQDLLVTQPKGNRQLTMNIHYDH